MAKKRPATISPGIRDRIVEMKRIRAGDLESHPTNYRTHGPDQLAALTGILGEVGIADALLAFPADGLGANGDFTRLMTFDGHARKDRDLNQVWPVIVTDLTREEADKMLLVIDPLAALAEHDSAKLDELLRSVETGDEALSKMLADLASEAGIIPPEDCEPVLKPINIMAPPAMTWVLVGIPTVRFGEINTQVEAFAGIDGLILETTSNDG